MHHGHPGFLLDSDGQLQLRRTDQRTSLGFLADSIVTVLNDPHSGSLLKPTLVPWSMPGPADGVGLFSNIPLAEPVELPLVDAIDAMDEMDKLPDLTNGVNRDTFGLNSR